LLLPAPPGGVERSVLAACPRPLPVASSARRRAQSSRAASGKSPVPARRPAPQDSRPSPRWIAEARRRVALARVPAVAWRHRGHSGRRPLCLRARATSCPGPCAPADPCRRAAYPAVRSHGRRPATSHASHSTLPGAGVARWCALGPRRIDRRQSRCAPPRLPLQPGPLWRGRPPAQPPARS